MMRVGLVGLPNVGKSSLFNLLTKSNARVDCFPFTTVEKNVGVVLVPDERLERLGALLKPEKVTPAHIEFVDIAGLVEGASRGEGLGNRFLSHIRETHLMLHILRAFDDGVVHPYGCVDPVRDAGVVEAELALADLEIVERRLQTLVKEAKTPENLNLLRALTKVRDALSAGQAPVLGEEEHQALRPFNLFVGRPVIYVLNCSEKEPFDINLWPGLRDRAKARRSGGVPGEQSSCSVPEGVFLFSAALEDGIGGFAEEEQRELRRSLNLDEAGPAGLVERCFRHLGLIRFYTIKGTETRAWAVPNGTGIVEAASQIHSDLANGFIRAEVLGYDDLVAAGDFCLAQRQGRVRVEGRNYSVRDGDVILIKFRA
ncbi:MAG: redox-regulated ATPase YchF [candidate division WOR-3 bacterium]